MNIDLSFSDGFDLNTGDQYLQENLNVFYSASAQQYDGVARNQADGTWYPTNEMFPEDIDPLPSAPYEISGNRISGGLTLAQSWPEGGDGSVEVTFDVKIPEAFHPNC